MGASLPPFVCFQLVVTHPRAPARVQLSRFQDREMALKALTLRLSVGRQGNNQEVARKGGMAVAGGGGVRGHWGPELRLEQWLTAVNARG